MTGTRACSLWPAATSRRSFATSRSSARSGDDLAAAVHGHLAVPVRGRRGPSRPLARSSCPPTPSRLRVQRNRARPQRGRGDARRSRPRRRPRPCPDLAARVERVAGLGGDRGRHRAARPRARSSDTLVHRKGGKTVTIPLAPRTTADRCRRRREMRGADLVRPLWRTARSAWRHPDRATHRPPRGSQARRTTLSATPSSPQHSTPVSRSATSKKPPAMPTRVPPCATTAPGFRSTDTRTTSCPPSIDRRIPLSPPETVRFARTSAERAICARVDRIDTANSHSTRRFGRRRGGAAGRPDARPSGRNRGLHLDELPSCAGDSDATEGCRWGSTSTSTVSTPGTTSRAVGSR